ncbi:DUF2093 domain-containing protein [Leptospira sp. severe_002]|uniref:DUF2093 domain-containing protein n=1 Tax=Leptospira sp. severe_002 TaxID=2838237 RepID=UPI001E5D8E73|nr:DUF2093 domain-containing protein [Leptospira sp. severe_002]
MGGHAKSRYGFNVRPRTIILPGTGSQTPQAEKSSPSRSFDVLNRYDRPSPMAGEAELKYLDGDFRIVRPGAFVRCAVTGIPIPLEELKYWNVDLQEPYSTPEAVLKRLHPQAAK